MILRPDRMVHMTEAERPRFYLAPTAGLGPSGPPGRAVSRPGP